MIELKPELVTSPETPIAKDRGEMFDPDLHNQDQMVLENAADNGLISLSFDPSAKIRELGQAAKDNLRSVLETDLSERVTPEV